MTKIAILQPSYIPWIGYFEQIMSVDIFVFYDDVQFTKNDWRNRNRIKVHNGVAWLSVPVESSKKNINEVRIDTTKKWKIKHLKTLKQYYSKSKYFEEIYTILETNINSNIDLISELSINIIQDISRYLGMNTKFYKSSNLNIFGDKNQRLVNICKYFDASIYVSGVSAKDYIDTHLFELNTIDIKFQEYKNVAYNQLHGSFIGYLSIIDLLFNYGRASKEMLIEKGIDV